MYIKVCCARTHRLNLTLQRYNKYIRKAKFFIKKGIKYTYYWYKSLYKKWAPIAGCSWKISFRNKKDFKKTRNNNGRIRTDIRLICNQLSIPFLHRVTCCMFLCSESWIWTNDGIAPPSLWEKCDWPLCHLAI